LRAVCPAPTIMPETLGLRSSLQTEGVEQLLPHVQQHIPRSGTTLWYSDAAPPSYHLGSLVSLESDVLGWLPSHPRVAGSRQVLLEGRGVGAPSQDAAVGRWGRDM
jgi:hypothetical protein